MTCRQLVLSLSAVVAIATSSCAQSIDDGEPATHAQCRAMAEHVADLQLGTVAGAHRVRDAEMLAHRRNLTRNDDDFDDHCLSHRTAAYARCALSSTTLDEYRACDVDPAQLALDVRSTER